MKSMSVSISTHDQRIKNWLKLFMVSTERTAEMVCFQQLEIAIG